MDTERHMKRPDDMTAAEIADAAGCKDGDEIGVECDECWTWIVDERRCSCGNRRVYWDWGQNTDGTFYFFPAVD
jgi:hypothetical protein